MSTLSFKPFYVHKVRNRMRHDSNRMKHAPRGFTALVTPTTHPRLINIQVAMCHYDDEFSKKMGRENASKSVIKTINSRDLGHEMEKLYSKIWTDNVKHNCGAFDYLFRYIV